MTLRPIEIALDAALLVMRNGGSTVAAERSFNNLLKGLKQEGVSTVWRLDFVAATQTGQGGSASVVRSVGGLGVNLVRASEIAVLGERVAQGEVPAEAVEAEIERIRHLPSPYSRWVTVLFAALTGAFFSQIPGGDWGSAGIAFVAAGLGQTLRGALQARKLAVGPITLICGVLSALIGAQGLRLGLSQVESATMIASVIYIVPGLPLINGFIDMLSHKHLFVGAERMLNAAFLFLVLGIALVFAHAVLLQGV